MKNLFTYTARLASALLLASVLVGCGAAASGAAGPTATSPQAARIAPSATMATATMEPTGTAASTATAEPTQTAASAATAEPTQVATAMSSPSASLTATEQPLAAHAAGHGTTVAADIKLFVYRPEPLEIQPGTTVVWTNQDDIDHSVTHGTPPAAGQAFDSGLFGKGRSFSFTFAEPGEYPYFCLRHNSMVGVVRVIGS